MRNLYRRLKKREDGSAVVLVAGAMVLLLGLAAFGVDLAWFYLNSSRIQRAADAASLGGVVHLPANEPAALNNALVVARQNGYDNAAADTQVDPVRIGANQLEVTVTQSVPTFFLKVFGKTSQTISEVARAEYIPPLKLGSPSNIFGNDPSCYASNPNCAPNFWANIHGRNTDTRMGDAFSSFCADNGGSTNGCAQQVNYRDSGYLYGVIPNGGSFTLQTLDMAFHNELGGVSNGDAHRTGDHNNFCGGPGCVGPTVTVNVYAPDPTPLVLDSALLCSKTYTPQNQFDPDDDPPFDPSVWSWDTVCTVNGTTADALYVVQVVNTSSNVNTSGLNRYSIKTNPGANLFGLRDFSMFNNSTATVSNFPLAEVPDYYAGKTFVVELYDPGDSNAGGTVQLRDPNGNVYPSCVMSTKSGDVANEPWNVQGTLTPCQFVALNNGGANDYNGDWIQLSADLPSTYSCANCWWEITYDFVGGVQDTTTWRAYMIGNPIHLIP